MTIDFPAQLPLRWLHLSDFHTGKDQYGQRKLFQYILRHIEQRVRDQAGPDAIFITGDITNRGLKHEYDEFANEFFWKLVDILPQGASDHIFIIPGNHDVDRTEAKAVLTYDVLLRVADFLDPTEKGQHERSLILPRFRAFADSDPTQPGEHWIYSPRGASFRTLTLRGVKIALVTVNTAWLSCSDDDRHRLSLGKGILEDALAEVTDHDLSIVLGHHPIDWLLDSELDPVRSLLGRHNSLYLHGHLHKGHLSIEDAAHYPFVAIQTGACFQAREHEAWINRITWAEFHKDRREIVLEPRLWSASTQEWVLDGAAYPERLRQGDKWVISLPEPLAAAPHPISATKRPVPKMVEPPDGWVIVDQAFLDSRRINLSAQQAESYFDGRTPIWREALAHQIPRREIVSSLVARISATHYSGELGVTLLTGPSGEGKTTAYLQTICDLVQQVEGLHVLWHQDTSAQFPAEYLAQLPAQEKWLVASDDAELVSRRVFDSVQAFHIAGRNNIQFFLCCRDTDWRSENADSLAWRDHCRFTESQMSGITDEDARRVVGAWSIYGKEGLKELASLNAEEAAKELCQMAKTETNPDGDGSFFGAILQVRWGDGLIDHVRDLLRKLSNRGLLDGFGMIAATHAEGKRCLSRPVLARALNIDLRELKARVLAPLGEKAAISTTGKLVFTRHSVIAKLTMGLLDSEFHIETDDYYVDMLRSAYELYNSGVYVPNLREWQYLSTHFFQKGNSYLAVRLANMAVRTRPDDPYLLVKLAQIHRETGNPEQAVDLMRNSSHMIAINERVYHFEWGIDESSVGNLAVGAWLAAYSLSDQITSQPPDYDVIRYGLKGLSEGMLRLYDAYYDRVFAQASNGAFCIAELLPLSGDEADMIARARARLGDLYLVEPNLESALGKVLSGVRAAQRLREYDAPEWAKRGNDLTFGGLERALERLLQH